jgi:hypothetical protein
MSSTYLRSLCFADVAHRACRGVFTFVWQGKLFVAHKKETHASIYLRFVALFQTTSLVVSYREHVVGSFVVKSILLCALTTVPG